MSIEPYTVPVYAGDGSLRVLCALRSSTDKANLEKFAVELGGTKFGDWYKMANVKGINSVLERAEEMGGIVYYLPIKGKEGTQSDSLVE